jgi:transcriptional regulator with XRE-family HTH domain
MTDTVGDAVARTVRTLRAAHGWSLDQLAARAGLSKGVLVALEQARGNPNLSTLIRVADTLGVPLTRLVQVEEEPPIQLFPASRHVVLWNGPSGGTGTLLAGSDPRPSLELWRWELRPGERRDSEPHSAGTREIISVEAGVLSLVVGESRTEVAAGDAALFHGDRAHAYANESDEDVRFILTVMD